MLSEIFEQWAKDFSPKQNAPVKYPLQFPHSRGVVMIQKPEHLQGYIDEFIEKYGASEFTFDGNIVTTTNENFLKYKEKVCQRIGNDYDNNRGKNFD